ncbi:MAG: hypothetical protein M3450_06545 [Actinomycetota bacterium]|nr:hypothetical protein [Actinomycetota bacterium]
MELVIPLSVGFALGTFSGRWASVPLALVLGFLYGYALVGEAESAAWLPAGLVGAGFVGASCAVGVLFRRFLDRRLAKKERELEVGSRDWPQA